MAAHLMSREEREKLASLRTPQELIELLRRSPAWDTAMAQLGAEGIDEQSFSEAIDHRIYEDFARLYRPANDESKEFLTFVTLEVELRAILATLRRLMAPVRGRFRDPLPAMVELLPGYDLDELNNVQSYAELTELASGGVFGETLRTMELDPRTGMPAMADAALLLEDRFYRALADYMATGYEGPAKKELLENVGFRADMLNIGYILRLRRFRTPIDKAMAWLLPLHGSMGTETERRILEAEDDSAAIEAIRASRAGRWIRNVKNVPPEKLIAEAKRSYYSHVLRGTPNIAVVDAFLQLDEEEGAMLKRVFVALTYGASPAEYI